MRVVTLIWSLMLIAGGLGACTRPVALAALGPAPLPTTVVAPARPDGCRWTPEDYSNARTRCATAGEGPVHEWEAFCACVQNTACRRWTIEDYQGKFEARYNQLVAEKIVSSCQQTYLTGPGKGPSIGTR